MTAAVQGALVFGTHTARTASARRTPPPDPGPELTARTLRKFHLGKLTLRYRLMQMFANHGYVTSQEIAIKGRTEWQWQKSATTAVREFRSPTRGWALAIPEAVRDGNEAKLKAEARLCVPEEIARAALYRMVMSQLRSGASVWLIEPESRERARELVIEADEDASRRASTADRCPRQRRSSREHRTEARRNE